MTVADQGLPPGKPLPDASHLNADFVRTLLQIEIKFTQAAKPGEPSNHRLWNGTQSERSDNDGRTITTPQ